MSAAAKNKSMSVMILAIAPLAMARIVYLRGQDVCPRHGVYIRARPSVALFEALPFKHVLLGSTGTACFSES